MIKCDMLESAVGFDPADGARSVFAQMIFTLVGAVGRNAADNQANSCLRYLTYNPYRTSFEQKRFVHHLRNQLLGHILKIIRAKPARTPSAGSNPAAFTNIPRAYLNLRSSAPLSAPICENPFLFSPRRNQRETLPFLLRNPRETLPASPHPPPQYSPKSFCPHPR